MTKKRISVLLIVAMVLSMLFAFPATAAVGPPPYTVFSSAFTNITTGNNQVGGSFTAAERNVNSWGNTVYFTLTLPEGVTYSETATSGTIANYVDGGTAGMFDAAGSNWLRVKLASPDAATTQSVRFTFANAGARLNVASNVSGDVRAVVDVMEVEGPAVHFVETDTRTIARVAAKAVTVSAAAATLIQMGSNKTGAKITIQEGRAASLLATEDIRLEIVTPGVTFAALPTPSVTGVTLGSVAPVGTDSRIVSVTLNGQSAIFGGKVEITPLLNLNPTVTSGDIRIRVRSASTDSALTATVLTVATVGTTQVEITAPQHNTATIYAGHDFDIIGTSAGTARFTLKATGGNVLPSGRIVVLEFIGADVDSFKVRARAGTAAWSSALTPSVQRFGTDDTKAWFEIKIFDGVDGWLPEGATEIQLYDFDVAAPGEAKAGDIKVKVAGGTIGVEGEVVIGKVAKPFTVAADVPRLAYPGLNQSAGTITITEAARGTMVACEVYLVLPLGVTFNSVPRVRVTEGDLTLASVDLKNEGRELWFDVTNKSSEASTITIDRISYNVSRAAMEGPLTVKVKGCDSCWYYEDHLATVVNARIGAGIGGATVFTIGSMAYTVDGKSLTMDVAPVIKNGRTLLPLRFAAEAAGVNADEIIWDPVRKAVTLIRGDRVVQVTIGSTTMLINGAVVTMDVAPEIIDGRTMLPIRWIGLALRANVEWNADARSVTVTPY